MLKKMALYVVVVICLFLMLGCGPKNYTVNLNPNAFSQLYVADNAVSAIEPRITFSRGDYLDARENKEAFGTSKHHIVLTDNEFSEAFYDGLKAFFEASNQSWAGIEEGDIKVNVELLETQSELKTGFWVIRVLSKLSTRITFIDVKTNKTIHQQTYEGYSDIVSPVGHVSMFKMVVNKSIVDCINKIGMDEELRDAIVSR